MRITLNDIYNKNKQIKIKKDRYIYIYKIILKYKK